MRDAGNASMASGPNDVSRLNEAGSTDSPKSNEMREGETTASALEKAGVGTKGIEEMENVKNMHVTGDSKPGINNYDVKDKKSDANGTVASENTDDGTVVQVTIGDKGNDLSADDKGDSGSHENGDEQAAEGLGEQANITPERNVEVDSIGVVNPVPNQSLLKGTGLQNSSAANASALSGHPRTDVDISVGVTDIGAENEKTTAITTETAIDVSDVPVNVTNNTDSSHDPIPTSTDGPVPKRSSNPSVTDGIFDPPHAVVESAGSIASIPNTTAVDAPLPATSAAHLSTVTAPAIATANKNICNSDVDVNSNLDGDDDDGDGDDMDNDDDDDLFAGLDDVATMDLYGVNNYTFGKKDSEAKSKMVSDLPERAISDALRKDYGRRGLRRSVRGVVLVHEHNFAHLLLLQRSDGKGEFSLPGGRLRPGENFEDGLMRKLSTKLCAVNSDKANQATLEIGDKLGKWYAIDFTRRYFPYIPAHVTKVKEEVHVYAVSLPSNFKFAVPKNLQLVAVPLCDVHNNLAMYGSMISAVPALLSRFHINFC